MEQEKLGVIVEAERIYTPAEAATLCGVSKMTILRAIRDGKLKANRPTPRKVWIWGADLRAWMLGKTV